MLKTEMRNPKTMHIDKMSTLEMLKIVNEENMNSVKAVEAELENIAKAVDAITAGFSKGGRLFYMGAGTSGRIGVLDASECPPTFGVSKGTVVGIIAGGYGAAEGEKALRFPKALKLTDTESGESVVGDTLKVKLRQFETKIFRMSNV